MIILQTNDVSRNFGSHISANVRSKQVPLLKGLKGVCPLCAHERRCLFSDWQQEAFPPKAHRCNSSGDAGDIKSLRDQMI